MAAKSPGGDGGGREVGVALGGQWETGSPRSYINTSITVNILGMVFTRVSPDVSTGGAEWRVLLCYFLKLCVNLPWSQNKKGKSNFKC